MTKICKLILKGPISHFVQNAGKNRQDRGKETTSNVLCAGTNGAGFAGKLTPTGTTGFAIRLGVAFRAILSKGTPGSESK